MAQVQPVQPVQPAKPKPQQRSHPKVVVPPPQAPPSAVFATAQPLQSAEPPVDYQLLLLTLAEEYIAAARGMGPMVALFRREMEVAQYHKLMATGMGCMETVLKNWRLHPRPEATLRFRYASLLYEETENTMAMETVLSKGIALCERNQLFDLKYSMHHLLARVLFKTGPRAAFKSLDSLIPDVEAYQHIAWAYAFRFLRVSLSLQNPSNTEILSALQNLRSISSIAEKRGDRSIFVTCAALEAMVHMQNASTDSIEQAQRAIASARSLQLQTSIRGLTQIVALLNCVDLACSLQQYTPEQASAKMETMQAVMDQAGQDANWNDDGSFAVLIENSSGGQTTASTGGIFQKSGDGRDMITFSWLQHRDLYMLGYYLSGVTAHLRNPTEGKAEKYLQAGLKATQGELPVVNQQIRAKWLTLETESLDVPDVAQGSLHGVSDRAKWQGLINWHMRLHLTFLSCNRADWATAKTWLGSLKQSKRTIEVSESQTRWTAYLSGVIEQGLGNTEAALSLFQAPMFALPPPTARVSSTPTDISILAALNSLLIIRDPSHPSHARAGPLVSALEPLCLSHPNKSIVSAFYLIRAICSRTSTSTSTNNSSTERQEPIIKLKQHLQQALQAAKAAANTQLLMLSMNFMTAMFFKDIVGEQAEKSARAGRQLAKRGGDKTWVCVSDGMLAETLDREGKREEAAVARREGEGLIAALPVGLREKCLHSG